jgi:hypothetical protein
VWRVGALALTFLSASLDGLVIELETLDGDAALARLRHHGAEDRALSRRSTTG